MADELIALDEALLELENVVANREPNWSGYWKAELARDLASLLKSPDELNDNSAGCAEKYPPDIRAWHVGDSAELWHNHQKATLFLRLELEERRLPAYVKDPGNGRLLPLLPEDWLPWTPEDRLSGDFLDSGNYGVVGCDGTRFYAQMKHALVHRKKFDEWLIKRLLYPSDRAREKEAVKRAVYALWDGYPPQALSAKIRDRQIREWIAKNEPEDFRLEKYSTATIKRALQDIQEEQLTLLRFKSAR